MSVTGIETIWAGGGASVSFAFTETALGSVAVRLAMVETVTALVEIVKVAVVVPEAIETEEGGVADA